MSFSVSAWLAITLYLVATAGTLRQLWKPQDLGALASLLARPLMIGVVAWLLHSYYATEVAFGITEVGVNQSETSAIVLNVSVHAMAVLVSAILVGTFIVLCTVLDVSRLAVIVFPLTVATFVFAQNWNTSASELLILSMDSSLNLKLHVIISILAYTFVSLATAQALVLRFQESQFKKRIKPTLMAALPPLETMAKLLVYLLSIGVVLLSLTLASGALFSKEIFGVPFEFNHHTILALLGWLVLCIALTAIVTDKLSSAQSTLWVVLGFVLIQLGYFGTKIIVDLIN